MGQTDRSPAATAVFSDTCLNPRDREYASQLIRYKANQLVGQRGFTSSDRDDLEQELVVAIWRRLSRFDADRACMRTFLDRIVQTKAASMCRHRYANKRHPAFEECSLDEPVKQKDGGEASRRDTMDEVACDLWTDIDRNTDLAEVIDALPEDLRRVAKEILVDSPAPAACRLGMKWPEMQRALRKLRKRFEDAGLHEYL